ncbi:MAG: S46 family peptidase [candidate division Zixibacteria bacterium]|nr:S46 family peptidase [candidate division Zixibacteria bacterium]
MSSFLRAVFFVFLISFFIPSLLMADGGMWPLYDLNKVPLKKVTAAGLELTAKEVYDPNGTALADAIVNLRGGTSSFVSADGLIITNHHVAFGAIQKQSSVSQNFINNGFYAETRYAEIPAIGYYAKVTLDVEDVTGRVTADIPEDITDLDRYKLKERRIKEIIAEKENNRDVECKIAKMYGGMKYILYTYFKIKDIRIVYAPPGSIGNFGGDIDNWMWPRHVGDFAFVRAYVAPDGSSAEYSTDNVVYHPKRFLPISSGGFSEGDVSLMIGFPGKTHRYASSYEIDYLLYYYFPLYLETSEKRIAILEEVASIDPEISIRLASTASGINNYLKKTHGIKRGFERARLLELKQIDEKALWTSLDTYQETDSFRQYLKDYESLYDGKIKSYQKDFYLNTLPRSCKMLEMAIKLYTWSVEREKSDMEREMGFQDRDIENFLRDLKNDQINLVPEYDRRILYYFLDKIVQLPSGQKIEMIENLFKGKDIESYLPQYAEYVFARSSLNNLDARLKMFEMTKSDLENLHDPLMNLAVTLKHELDGLKIREKTFNGAKERLEPGFIRALMKWKKTEMHPDANGTKRFNWGTVKGYQPRDAISYYHITTLSGVMEKETLNEPFIIPLELKQAYENRDFSKYADSKSGDIPVNFITTNSGTNGNSGSPIINGKGELIGLDFDTSLDGVSADYYYNPDWARSIVVDSRYILFLIDKVYKLDNLMKELTIH